MSVGQAKTIPEKYQSKVGRMQDADRIYAKEDGYFCFMDYEFSGKELRNFLKSQYTTAVVSNSAGVLSLITAGDSAPPVAPKYGYLILSLANPASNASLRLPSAHIGNILVIDATGASVSDCSVLVCASGTAGSGITGVSLVGIGSASPLSALGFANDASQGYAKLACLTEGTWSVIERSAEVVEKAAA